MEKRVMAALILAAVMGAASAAMPAFEELDTNADGSLSKDEAAAVEGLDFDAADTNADGQLSPDEYAVSTTE